MFSQNGKRRILLYLKKIDVGVKPKKLIHELSEDLLKHFDDLNLIDNYDIYQHLMNYWAETMQDDVYEIADEGWKAGNEVDWATKGKVFEGRLIPKQILIARYFSSEQKAIEELEAKRDSITQQIEELEEEQGGDEGYFSQLDKVNKANVQKRLKELEKEKSEMDFKIAAEPKTKYNNSEDDEAGVLKKYLKLSDQVAVANKKIKEAQAELETKLLAKYAALSEDEIKVLVVDDKWMTHLYTQVQSEMQRISQRLLKELKNLPNAMTHPYQKLIQKLMNWKRKFRNI